jgi:hypothetical protein
MKKAITASGAALLLALFVVACGSSGDAPPTSQGAPPHMTPEVGAKITAMAIVEACGSGCPPTVYVRDQLIKVTTEVGQEQPMSDATQQAIADEVPGVRFVRQTESLFGPSGAIDGGNSLLITVGPVEDLAPGIVGIEVGVTPRLFGGHGQVYQFQWSGSSWEPATSDVTGVTTTSWVS